MSKSILITVLTWNDWENTVVCLESIFHNDYQNFDVLLINNGSEKYHIQKIEMKCISFSVNCSVFLECMYRHRELILVLYVQ